MNIKNNCLMIQWFCAEHTLHTTIQVNNYTSIYVYIHT